MDPGQSSLDAAMKERFATLPKPVQEAITSADVEQHLRELANTHKLHLDQWTALENEVMLTLLGMEPIGNLAPNIQKEVGVDSAVATALATDISNTVFAPIRSELERLLEHPGAEQAQKTGVEGVRERVLQGKEAAQPAAPVQPATPPPQAPEKKVERGTLAPASALQKASHERKVIQGDPYREQIS